MTGDCVRGLIHPARARDEVGPTGDRLGEDDLSSVIRHLSSEIARLLLPV
jgi:hypothetical protein